MIPDKRKDKRLWSELSIKERAKILTRPASTELQILAQKENFALFQLMGMKGNAQHMLYDTFCPIPDAVLITIVNACERGIEAIKAEQYYRKQQRKSK